ncbi:hypothetical protein Glove_139g123 [Diversispora epigaea]|uniref:Uncharacterized protein n=1 Tax=Diversispora epigaea TaxID=1348612 RepID=A0A397IZS4_9GLOM|nr:hypothetical protein Glove_139g123 [Diversispora epigaea]
MSTTFEVLAYTSSQKGTFVSGIVKLQQQHQQQQSMRFDDMDLEQYNSVLDMRAFIFGYK